MPDAADGGMTKPRRGHGLLERQTRNRSSQQSGLGCDRATCRVLREQPAGLAVTRAVPEVQPGGAVPTGPCRVSRSLADGQVNEGRPRQEEQYGDPDV